MHPKCLFEAPQHFGEKDWKFVFLLSTLKE